MGGSDITTTTAIDLSVEKKNTLNANNDNTANNQDFLDLLGLDMSSTTQSLNIAATTNATSNALNTNMNNVLVGSGNSSIGSIGNSMIGGLGDLNNILSTTTTVPTNGNDLSSIMAAVSITSPSMDVSVNSLMNDPLATTTASNNVSVVCCNVFFIFCFRLFLYVLIIIIIINNLKIHMCLASRIEIDSSE